MILCFNPTADHRRSLIIGLEPEEARAILRGGTVETTNDVQTVLIGRAAEIIQELREISERKQIPVNWLKA